MSILVNALFHLSCPPVFLSSCPHVIMSVCPTIIPSSCSPVPLPSCPPIIVFVSLFHTILLIFLLRKIGGQYDCRAGGPGAMRTGGQET